VTGLGRNEATFAVGAYSPDTGTPYCCSTGVARAKEHDLKEIVIVSALGTLR
jgi:hypothetical protein